MGASFRAFSPTTKPEFPHFLSDSLPVGVPFPNVCCKRVIIHKANTEMNKLAGRKRLSRDYVGESYGIFATRLVEDNTNSSLRIESLYDSSHVVPAPLPPFPDYIAYALHTIVGGLCSVFCHMNAVEVCHT